MRQDLFNLVNNTRRSDHCQTLMSETEYQRLKVSPLPVWVWIGLGGLAVLVLLGGITLI